MLLVLASCLTARPGSGHAALFQDRHTIQGIVMETSTGTPDVPVFLCEDDSGLPLLRSTWKPPESGAPDFQAWTRDMAVILSDEKGRFRFEDLPDGRYRLVAQQWTGPFKGCFESHGTIIQLFGSAGNIRVPRPTDSREARIILTPPGQGIVEFDQKVPNQDTLLLISTEPPDFDPILGPYCLGRDFMRNLIGINRMPLGRTTVVGAPTGTLHAFCFAPDNSPGFCTLDIAPASSAYRRVPTEPFVAGWSDGRKHPVGPIGELVEKLDRKKWDVNALLEIPPLSNATHRAHQERMKQLLQELHRSVPLPDESNARIGDLLAAQGYLRLRQP